MPNDLVLHHLGVATRSIERELPCYEAVGYRVASAPFIDQKQGVKGLFVEALGQPTLELLENIGPGGPLDDCLARGIKIYHFAYAVDDIDAAVSDLTRRARARVIVPATGAVCFKKICFLMLPNMLMIEMVQQ